MAKRKVLFVCHNHPAVSPGGAEVYALQLYEALRDAGDFEPLFLARVGPAAAAHPGTPFGLVNGDPNQYLAHVGPDRFDAFLLAARDKDLVTNHYHEFLRAHRPDVVHFQHTLFLGVDLLRQTRATLPGAAVVYTLHEFGPICHRHGQMVRTRANEPCREASPRRCHECFPDISPQDFFLRRRFLLAHFEYVDLFLAPSRFLRDRYVAWGLPAEKVRVEEYGRPAVPPAAADPGPRPRNRLGFFGVLGPYKGVDVLLRAVRLLADDGVDVRLWLHGAAAELRDAGFQERLQSLLQATQDRVVCSGRYEPAEVPRLMADVDWVVVPSVWWENSPLVIQEAFQHLKPVVCSDIGGMAEKVAHEVNGLHFRAGDPHSLAVTLRRALETPGLWERLRAGIAPVYSMEDHVRTLTRIYDEILERRRGSWPFYPGTPMSLLETPRSPTTACRPKEVSGGLPEAEIPGTRQLHPARPEARRAGAGTRGRYHGHQRGGLGRVDDRRLLRGRNRPPRRAGDGERRPHQGRRHADQMPKCLRPRHLRP